MTTIPKTPLRRRALLSVCAAAVAIAAVRPMAAQDAPPKAAELLAKNVAAIGGADAFKAIKSIRARGTFEMPAQSVSGTVEISQARPAFSRLIINIQGIGQADQGCDGKICWTVDPMSGPALLSGKALADAKADAFFDGQLFGPDYVKEATTLEKSKFGDRPAYKIKLVTTFGSERTIYLDADSFLVIGAEAVAESPMGPMPTTTSTGEYKKFGVLMQPTTMVQTAMGFDQIIRMTSFEYDVVEPAAFEPPPAVKALIK
jgi:hypothetical protein